MGVPTVAFLIQLPANVLGKQSKMAQVLRPYTHVVNPKEAPSSWLQKGSVMFMWGMNQRMEDFCLSLSNKEIVFKKLLSPLMISFRLSVYNILEVVKL